MSCKYCSQHNCKHTQRLGYSRVPSPAAAWIMQDTFLLHAETRTLILSLRLRSGPHPFRIHLEKLETATSRYLLGFIPAPKAPARDLASSLQCWTLQHCYISSREPERLSGAGSNPHLDLYQEGIKDPFHIPH